MYVLYKRKLARKTVTLRLLSDKKHVCSINGIYQPVLSTKSHALPTKNNSRTDVLGTPMSDNNHYFVGYMSLNWYPVNKIIGNKCNIKSKIVTCNIERQRLAT
jgi:hypothetical protein